MKDEDLTGAIQKVVRNVFESMYYMFPETLEAQDQPPVPESCFRASVGIENSPLKVVLYGSEKLVKDMATALLGSERAIEEDECVDIFREAANLIGGNLVNAMDLDKSVGLGVPEVQLVDTVEELDTEPGTAFDIDGEFFKAAVLS
jgi:hypothetical protein